MKTMHDVLSAEKYEASRPRGEQKLVIGDFVVRAYIDADGLNVLAHRLTEDHKETLPMAYLLGTNMLMLGQKKK